MKVSVVIPAHNEASYIGATLRSLRTQTLRPYEVIVVDNGSTDDTKRQARAYGARVISHLIKGVSGARQKGLRSARGDIVAFTDADTIVPENWTARIVMPFTDPGVVATYGNYRVADGPWWFCMYANYLQGPLFSALTAFGIDLPVGANMALRKQPAIIAGGFPASFKMVEDNEIIRRMKTVGHVKFIPDLLVTTSGRRGREGIFLPIRYAVALSVYIVSGRGDIIGFRDFR